MGLTGSLELGKSALLSYQSALQVIGNNIANAGVDGYSRQTPTMTSLQGVELPEGLLSGGGVALTALQRHMDQALESRLRSAMSDQENAATQSQSLIDIESLYGELSDSDLSTALSDFFNAFNAVESAAGGDESASARSQAITAGQTLADKIQRMRTQLMDAHDQKNADLTDCVNQANTLAGQIADLNLEVVRAEAAGNGAAASLRDQRDNALKDLSKLMDIQVYETPEGAANVYAGSEPLVQYGTSRGLTAEQDQAGDRTVISVHFADNGGSVNIQSGEIAGLVTSRDTHVYGQIEKLDGLAANLIYQVNEVHSQGQGLTGYESTTGSSDVLDATAALNTSEAGLTFTPTTGSFKMTVTTVTDATADPPKTESLEYDVPITLTGGSADTTLTSLADYITDNVTGVTATVTGDNRLALAAGANKTFTFGKDTSGVLGCLGINSFFTGTNAASIAVDSTLAANPQYLAASSNGQPGDGGNAGAIADLADDSKLPAGTVSISAQWRSIVSSLAVISGTAKSTSESAENIAESLKSQRESISGVDTNEEAVNLMTYQRTFQAAARYINIVDQLVEEMLNMVQ